MQEILQPFGAEILRAEESASRKGFLNPAEPLPDVLRGPTTRFERLFPIVEVYSENPYAVIAVPIHEPGFLILDFLEQFGKHHGGGIFIRREANAFARAIGVTNIGHPLSRWLQEVPPVLGKTMKYVPLAFKHANVVVRVLADDLGVRGQDVGSIGSEECRHEGYL